MKKNLILSLLLLFSINVSATIAYDKTEDNGVRNIATIEEDCRNGFSARYPLYVSLERFSIDDNVTWFLYFRINNTSSFVLPQDGILLIKLGDDSVIECKQLLKDHDTEDIIGEYIPGAMTNIHYMHAKYELSTEQLKQIMRLGVKKLRFEKAVDWIDIEYKKEKLGKILTDSYIEIMKSSRKSTNIRDNF